MDKRIILLIAIFWLGSLSFFVYHKYYSKAPSIQFEIRPNTDNTILHAGDSILFQDNTAGANRWKWDFGDGEYSSDQSGKHIYMNPGTFTLAITAYGGFGSQRTTKTVKVMQGAMAIPSSSAMSILGPSEANTKQQVSFSASATAASYEWSIEGDPAQRNNIKKGQSADYSFAKPGSFTIVLKTKNPDASVNKVFVVNGVVPEAAATPVVRRPEPVHIQQAPKPKPVQQHKPKSDGLPDLGDGVEYHK
ncbi:MAG: PKD domain-containing protein [Chitinophagaceae bacterium]